MSAGLFSLGIISLLLGTTLFIGTNFKRVQTTTVEVPYTEEVPYEVEVEYEALEPYQVQVSYEAEVQVNRAELFYENSSALDHNGLTTYEITLPNQTIMIEWSSTKTLIYFGIMKPST